MTAEEAEGNTVEAELLKRSGRKSRKFARMLKRRARQTERMASELEANAEASFNWVSRGYGAACSGRSYDPSTSKKWVNGDVKHLEIDLVAFTKNLLAQIPDHRGAQQLLDRVPPASARTHAESVCSTTRDAIGKPPASRAGSMSARITPSAAAMGPGVFVKYLHGSGTGCDYMKESSMPGRWMHDAGADTQIQGKTAHKNSIRASTACSRVSSCGSMRSAASWMPPAKSRQELFLTTRRGPNRPLAQSMNDCALSAWLSREQVRRDTMRAEAKEKEAADSMLRSSHAQTLRVRNGRPTSSGSVESDVQYNRVRHQQMHELMGMRSRGVICHSFRNEIPKPFQKYATKELKGEGVTGNTVPARHPKGEFTDLLDRRATWSWSLQTQKLN